jgi:hypothetical protein
MDWMTLAIEITGLAIICIWIVIPVQEFRGIMDRVRNKPDLAEPTKPSNPSGERH